MTDSDGSGSDGSGSDNGASDTAAQDTAEAAHRRAAALRAAKAALHRTLAGEGGEDPAAAEDRAWESTARRLREDRPPHWG